MKQSNRMTPSDWVDSTLHEFGNPTWVVSEMLDTLETVMGDQWTNQARSHLAKQNGEIH